MGGIKKYAPPEKPKRRSKKHCLKHGVKTKTELKEARAESARKRKVAAKEREKLVEIERKIAKGLHIRKREVVDDDTRQPNEISEASSPADASDAPFSLVGGLGISHESIKAQLLAIPEDKRDFVLSQAFRTINQCFIPAPGPQTAAYYSKADILLYGGQASGGKSALGVGLALTAHKKSLIMRPQYTELTDLIDKALKFYGTREGFNGSSPPSLKTSDGRFIQFGACANPGDEFNWQGQEHDLKFFDEVVNFREDQVRFIMTWNRTDAESVKRGQRVRTVFASNPPVNTQGDWIIGMFRPWLDVTHHNPAADGELRWFITDKDGRDIEVESEHPKEDGYKADGTKRLLIPKSRTFIRSSIDDNPYADPNYKATLDAMKEPYRSALRDGNFMLARKDEDGQLIPTQWVRDAQSRWTEQPPMNVPMCAMGVDPAAGGPDETVIISRYDGYFAKPIVIAGVDTPYPQDVAAKVIRYRKDGAVPVVDCGGGYGGGIVRHLQDNGIEAKAHKGSEASAKRTKDRLHPFASKRAEVYWRFMEALDPSQDGGSPIALPPDPKLMSDLCSVRYKVTTRGIQLESKDDMKKRLGRSPDRGDAVVMAWSYGDTVVNLRGGQWNGKTNQRPKAVLGHMGQRRTR